MKHRNDDGKGGQSKGEDGGKKNKDEKCHVSRLEVYISGPDGDTTEEEDANPEQFRSSASRFSMKRALINCAHCQHGLPNFSSFAYVDKATKDFQAFRDGTLQGRKLRCPMR